MEGPQINLFDETFPQIDPVNQDSLLDTPMKEVPVWTFKRGWIEDRNVRGAVDDMNVKGAQPNTLLRGYAGMPQPEGSLLLSAQYTGYAPSGVHIPQNRNAKRVWWDVEENVNILEPEDIDNIVEGFGLQQRNISLMTIFLVLFVIFLLICGRTCENASMLFGTFFLFWILQDGLQYIAEGNVRLVLSWIVAILFALNVAVLSSGILFKK